MHTCRFSPSLTLFSLVLVFCFFSIVRSQVLYINEVLGNSGPFQEDWIELYNPRSSAYVKTDFYLSDKPAEFKFPFQLEIAGFGYWVVNRYNNGVEPFFGNATNKDGFGISSAGETIYLSDKTRAVLTSATLGGARPGQTYGIWRTSRGLKFTLLSRSTKGSVNAYPYVGPVVFTEIMAQPPEVKPQWISIMNRGSTTVKLFEPTDPAKAPWKVKGVDMTFPPNQELLPGQIAFLCSASVAQADFETAWSTLLTVSPAPKIFCNWNGTLRFSDQISLLSSFFENTDPLNPVLYVPEDIVLFNSSSVPSGTSLKRVNLASYGDEPSNWASSSRVMQNNCTVSDDCLKVVDNCTLVDCVSSECTYTMSTVAPICAAAPTPTPSTSGPTTTPTPTPTTSNPTPSPGTSSGSPREQSVTSVITGVFFALALLRCLH